MPDWRQWLGIYVALVIGGIAAWIFHFTGYIVILLLALGLLGITAYHDQKKLNEYEVNEDKRRKS